ncbi:MAG: hypothetical protein V7K49_21870 [Nostoc sp.]
MNSLRLVKQSSGRVSRHKGTAVRDFQIKKCPKTDAKTLSFLLSLCRASCLKSGNRKGALVSLCLCGSLRQAAARLRLFG